MPNLVSIIITTYNASKTICETLECIENQIYNNFEVIIVDDGSSDATVDIVKAYIKSSNIRHYQICSEGRIGRAKALAKACNLASGEYVAIIDADDIWHSQKLEIQMRIILENNIDFLCTKSDIFTKSSELSTKLEYDGVGEKNIPDKIGQFTILINNPISHSSVVMKRILAHYDVTRKKIIDYELWLRLIQKTELYILSEVLTFHRVHDSQHFEGKGIFGGTLYSLRSVFLRLKYSYRQRHLKAICVNALITIGYLLGLAKILRMMKTHRKIKNLSYLFEKLRARIFKCIEN